MEFFKINFRSPNIFLPWIVIGTGTIGLWTLGLVTLGSTYFILAIVFTLVLMLLYGLCFVTRIKLTEEGIEYSNPDKKVSISWTDIKTVGVYSSYRGTITWLARGEYEKFMFEEQKFIYISTRNNFTPLSGQKVDSSYIHFHWRKDAWKEIEKRITTA